MAYHALSRLAAFHREDATLIISIDTDLKDCLLWLLSQSPDAVAISGMSSFLGDFNSVELLAKFLINAGIDPNIKDPDNGATALHYVAKQAWSRGVVVEPLKTKARTNIFDDLGIAPLGYAAVANNIEARQEFVKYGSPVLGLASSFMNFKTNRARIKKHKFVKVCLQHLQGLDTKHAIPAELAILREADRKIAVYDELAATRRKWQWKPVPTLGVIVYLVSFSTSEDFLKLQIQQAAKIVEELKANEFSNLGFNLALDIKPDSWLLLLEPPRNHQGSRLGRQILVLLSQSRKPWRDFHEYLALLVDYTEDTYLQRLVSWSLLEIRRGQQVLDERNWNGFIHNDSALELAHALLHRRAWIKVFFFQGSLIELCAQLPPLRLTPVLPDGPFMLTVKQSIQQQMELIPTGQKAPLLVRSGRPPVYPGVP